MPNDCKVDASGRRRPQRIIRTSGAPGCDVQVGNARLGAIKVDGVASDAFVSVDPDGVRLACGRPSTGGFATRDEGPQRGVGS